MNKCPLENVCYKGNICCIDCKEINCDQRCEDRYGFCPDAETEEIENGTM